MEVNHSAGLLTEKDPEGKDPEGKEPEDKESFLSKAAENKPQFDVDPEFAAEMHQRQAEERAVHEQHIAEEAKKEQEAKKKQDDQQPATPEHHEKPDMSKIYPDANASAKPVDESKIKNAPTDTFDHALNNIITITFILGIIAGIINIIYNCSFFTEFNVSMTLRYAGLILAIIALIVVYAKGDNVTEDDYTDKQKFLLLASTIIPAYIIGKTLTGLIVVIPQFGRYIGPFVGFFIASFLHHYVLNRVEIRPNYISTGLKLAVAVVFNGIALITAISTLPAGYEFSYDFLSAIIFYPSLVAADLLSMYIVFRAIK